MKSMKVLIIYSSTHHKNTERIAQAMAEVLGADLVETQNAKAEDILNYDLIGFDSGIYMWEHHKLLLKFVDRLKPASGKKVFIFSTSGAPYGKKHHKKLREELIKKGFNIVGEFNCLGWDTVGLLKLIGGMNKGRPNEQDIENAKNFAKELMKIKN